MTPEAYFLHKVAKKAMKGEPLSSSEVSKTPQLIDKVYGDGDGDLDLHDVDDIAVNLATETTDKLSDFFDFITSLF